MEELRESFFRAYTRLIITKDFALSLLYNEWNKVFKKISGKKVLKRYEDFKRLHKYHILCDIEGDSYWNNYLYLYSHFMYDVFNDSRYLKANDRIVSMPVINFLNFNGIY